MTQYNVQLQDGNGSLAGLRNLLINGDMRVWQRGLGPGNPSTGNERVYLTADRWFKFNIGDTNQRINVSSDNFDGVTGRFNYANRINGTQSGRIIGQCIEGPLPAGEVTYSAWIRFSEQPINCYMTTNSTALVGLNDFDGFYGGTGTSVSYVNPDGWPGIYPGNNIWFKIQRTFTPVSPELGIPIAIQSVFSASTTATMDVTGVQLEPGPIATPFEQRQIALELSLCQRYFESQIARQTQDDAKYYNWHVAKRVVPTMTGPSGWSVNSQNSPDFYTVGTGAAAITGTVNGDAEL